MSDPTIPDYLKYAELQMAAEAFINEKINSGGTLTEALTEGNKHASFFTETEADKFSKEWVVLDQCKNTASGFSGTLFQNINT